MSAPDLNLLVTLDVLLTQDGVAGAARRLRPSPSAMSRALARLRETTGDPAATPRFPVSLLWHPRPDADPAHRWLRGCVRDPCAQAAQAIEAESRSA